MIKTPYTQQLYVIIATEGRDSGKMADVWLNIFENLN